MVHDMKKNESGIINKFKKFQNEQVALICKTGKDTWDRYAISELHNDNEEEQWSDDFDSDYENPDDHSEMYVVPSEENPDDSYEPPPSEQEKKKIPSAFPISRGEYADNRTSHQQLPPISKALPSTPSPATSRPKKPSVPSLPLPSECSDDEDNYIVPSFKLIKERLLLYSLLLHMIFFLNSYFTRFAKPLPSVPAQNTEHSHMHSMTRESPKLDTSRNILPLPRNRLHPKPVNHSFNNTQESRFPTGPAPSPLPRGFDMPFNIWFSSDLLQKPCPPSRETLTINEEKPTAAERRRGSSQELPLPPLPSEVPEAANRSLGTSPHSSISSISSTADQDAGVHSKAWYAATCDRKTAEDALYRSNKDGSFLIRKSSGQDSRQPYTLVVFYNRRVYNIPIRFIESTRQYALGREKSGEERFDSVAEIVENHQHSSLVLIDSQNNTKDCTKLKHIVRVSQSN
uniref:B cell linker n=2 Tax=Amazona TaxID=12929 RepID=A0A8B9G7A1_9PSIT